MTMDARESVMLKVWPRMTWVAMILAAGNLIMAVVVKLWGGWLHPVFADPHSWLLFLVTGASLGAQAALMRYTQHILMREAANVQARLGARERQRRMMHRRTDRLRHQARHRRMGGMLWSMAGVDEAGDRA